MEDVLPPDIIRIVEAYVIPQHLYIVKDGWDHKTIHRRSKSGYWRELRSAQDNNFFGRTSYKLINTSLVCRDMLSNHVITYSLSMQPLLYRVIGSCSDLYLIVNLYQYNVEIHSIQQQRLITRIPGHCDLHGIRFGDCLYLTDNHEHQTHKTIFIVNIVSSVVTYLSVPRSLCRIYGLVEIDGILILVGTSDHKTIHIYRLCGEKWVCVGFICGKSCMVCGIERKLVLYTNKIHIFDITTYSLETITLSFRISHIFSD